MTPQPTLFDAIQAEVKQKPIGTFHNTINLQGEELHKRELKVDSQNRKILDHFRANPGYRITPWLVLERFGWPDWKIVSVRRAITDLTDCDQKYLIKTDEKIIEKCGEWNYIWTLNPCADQASYEISFEGRLKKFAHNAAI